MSQVTDRAIIVGCGYTGRRVARSLLGRGWSVTATSRSAGNLADLADRGARVLEFDAHHSACLDTAVSGASVLISVPTLRTGEALDDPTRRLVAALDGSPRHLTYLSTTGVYGRAGEVDATTTPKPVTRRQELRKLAEDSVLEHDAPSLVLRPAAIYGPGRGVHAAMREGRMRLARGASRWVSRIHVGDLARIVVACMVRRVEGAYPVADSQPAATREVAAFCARLLDIEVPPYVDESRLPETLRTGRRVDGSAILSLLGLELLHPTFKDGIRASLAVEQDE